MKKRQSIGCIIAGIVLAGSFIVSLHNEKRHLLAMAEETFLEAVNRDLDRRVNLFGNSIVFSQPITRENVEIVVKEYGLK